MVYAFSISNFKATDADFPVVALFRGHYEYYHRLSDMEWICFGMAIYAL